MPAATKLPTLIALLSAGLLALPACQPAADDTQPAERSGQIEASEALDIVISLAGELDKDELHAIATHVEQSAPGEVMGARVKVEATGEGTQMTIMLMGSELGDGGAIAADLKSNFPSLADAEIVAAAGQPSQPMAHSDAEDPDVAAAEIKEQLIEQGVDGDIAVEVEDDDQGNRKVEVKVEKQVEG